METCPLQVHVFMNRGFRKTSLVHVQRPTEDRCDLICESVARKGTKKTGKRRERKAQSIHRFLSSSRLAPLIGSFHSSRRPTTGTRWTASEGAAIACRWRWLLRCKAGSLRSTLNAGNTWQRRSSSRPASWTHTRHCTIHSGADPRRPFTACTTYAGVLK